jgi:hypothetical protein
LFVLKATNGALMRNAIQLPLIKNTKVTKAWAIISGSTNLIIYENVLIFLNSKIKIRKL